MQSKCNAQAANACAGNEYWRMWSFKFHKKQALYFNARRFVQIDFEP